MKKSAFTLSEVLVTLGVIGVVASITMPTVINSYQSMTQASQLKKAYSILGQALKSALNDTKAVTLDETEYNKNNNDAPMNFVKKYFKTIRGCGKSLTPCFATSYKTINGNSFTLQKPLYAAVLADGTAISIYSNEIEFKTDDPTPGHFKVQIDINAQKGPNVVGRDLFYMELYADGKIGETRSTTDNIASKCDGGSGDGVGKGCLSRIIKDGWKMKY